MKKIIIQRYIYHNYKKNITHQSYQMSMGFLLKQSDLPFSPSILTALVINNDSIDYSNSNRVTTLCTNLPTTGQDNQCDACVSIGSGAGRTAQSFGSVALGHYAAGGDESNNPESATRQGAVACAIGTHAGYFNQGAGSVACGYAAGNISQGQCAVSLGFQTGAFAQGTNSVAIGVNAAAETQGSDSVAIGNEAGNAVQKNHCVAIGSYSGCSNQGTYSVAIGAEAGYSEQGNGSVLIGKSAGYYHQGENSIVIGFEAASGNIISQPKPKGTIAIGAYSPTEQGAFAIYIGSTSTPLNGFAQSAKSIHINASGNNATTIPPSDSLTFRTGGKGGVYMNSIKQKNNHPTGGLYTPVFYNVATNELYTLTPSA